MHRYLHNYEDFLLIDDDYVARVSSKIALGPKKRPHSGSWDDDDEFDSNDDEFDEDEDDDEYDDYDDRFEGRDR